MIRVYRLLYYDSWINSYPDSPLLQYNDKLYQYIILYILSKEEKGDSICFTLIKKEKREIYYYYLLFIIIIIIRLLAAWCNRKHATMAYSYQKPY
jgi:hypothetical protein